MRLLVLADAHIRRRSRRRLPDAVYTPLEQVDLVLHVGDVVVADVLDELGGFAPVHAVLGNNDAELTGLLPETLRKRFPGAGLVVFGHSHIPWNETGVDGQVLFNPGSPTERRRQPRHTVGRIDIEAGRIRSARIEAV